MSPRAAVRRSQGQGSLEERPAGSGRYRGRVYVGRREDGKLHYAQTTIVAPNRSKADELWGEWCREQRALYGGRARLGEPLRAPFPTFGDLLRTYAKDKSPGWTPKGRQTHAEFIEGYLLPLHDYPPERVTPTMLGDLYAGLVASGGTTRAGRATRGGRLSKTTVDRLDTMVKAAFAHAIDQDRFVARNPAKHRDAQLWRTHVEELSVEDVLDDDEDEDVRGRVPERWEVRRLVEGTWEVDPDLGAPVTLVARCGPRRGELLALTLSDWDSFRRQLRIAKRLTGGDGGEVLVAGTKDGTKKGFKPRVIKVAPDVAAVLDAHIASTRLRAVAAADPKVFAAVVRQRRLAVGLSQTALGQRVGMGQHGVSVLERGRAYQGRGSVAPGPAVMGALALELGLDWQEFDAAEGAFRRNGFLFSPAPDGSRHWSLRTGSLWVPGLCERLGLEPIGLQGLRRRVSSDLVASGTQAKDLVALMGHSLAVAIRYYTDSTEVSREAAVSRLATLYHGTADEAAEVVGLDRRTG